MHVMIQVPQKRQLIFLNYFLNIFKKAQVPSRVNALAELLRELDRIYKNAISALP
jgi:hypothetical protein